MSGSSKSSNISIFIGVRVAGPATYVPAHSQNGTGKQIRQMATVNVYQNLNGKRSKFRLTGWGKMADIVARSCATGKELTVICEANTYPGQVPTPGLQPGQPLTFVTGPDGQPITVEKTGFTIRNIHFGADSDKQVAAEIQAGARPPMWNVNGHADNIAWKNICQQRNAVNFVQGQTGFGYANVRLPNGTIIDPATIVSQRQANAAAPAGTAQVQTTGFQGVVQQPAQQPAPVADPVMVNNQNMGYPVNTAAPAATAPVAGQFQM